MKKLGFFLVALSVVFNFTSCLESSSVTEGQGIGVLEFNEGGYLVLKSNLGHVYANNLDALALSGKMEIGSCYIFAYRHDSNVPENTPAMIELYQFETITLIDYREIPKSYASSMMTDKDNALMDEVPLKDAYNSGNPYIDNYFFIWSIVNQQEDLELNWILSYDSDNYVTIENGIRYYDIYIRATARNTSSQTSRIEAVHLNAFNVGLYLANIASIEKAALENSYSVNSKLNLRVNYVTEISEEAKELTWSSKVITDIYLAPFVSK
jgi:hypothetical protein